MKFSTLSEEEFTNYTKKHFKQLSLKHTSEPTKP
ncbi:hypothetical protein, partial [Staphylococcus aureus]